MDIRKNVLGYDLRVSPYHLQKLWDENKRRNFIIGRLDSIPLSVDQMVWPSIFDYGVGMGMSSSQRDSLMYSGLITPKWTGPNSGLWENIDLLTNQVSDNPMLNDYQLIAVCCLDYDVTGLYPINKPYLDKSRIIDIHLDNKRNWNFLGIDVASASMLSAISNCGYTPEEMGEIRCKWGGDLNEHNLFVDELRADEYRIMVNTLIPEEMPFYRLEIYLAS